MRLQLLAYKVRRVIQMLGCGVCCRWCGPERSLLVPSSWSKFVPQRETVRLGLRAFAHGGQFPLGDARRRGIGK